MSSDPLSKLKSYWTFGKFIGQCPVTCAYFRPWIQGKFSRVMSRMLIYNLSVYKRLTRSIFTGIKTLKDHESYYDVLGVNRSCSQKELKSAYVKLCKKYHPDIKPGDPNQHQKFVSLRQAYDVLSQPDSRSRYDSTLISRRRTVSYANSENGNMRQAWRDDTIWSMREKSQDRYYENKNHYGPFSRNDKRIPHIHIVYGCIFIVSTGALLHIMFYNLMASISDRRLREKDTQNFEIYAEVRSKALENSNAKQLELIFEKVNSNPKSES